MERRVQSVQGVDLAIFEDSYGAHDISGVAKNVHVTLRFQVAPWFQVAPRFRRPVISSRPAFSSRPAISSRPLISSRPAISSFAVFISHSCNSTTCEESFPFSYFFRYLESIFFEIFIILKLEKVGLKLCRSMIDDCL